MNKTININCITLNSIYSYKFKIIIYNKDNNIIFNNYTKNNSIYFKLKTNEIYKIIIIPPTNHIPNIIKTNYLITNKSKNKINFYFKLKNKNNLITINLIDKYYKSLKLKRGEIILWQNNIK